MRRAQRPQQTEKPRQLKAGGSASSEESETSHPQANKLDDGMTGEHDPAMLEGRLGEMVPESHHEQVEDKKAHEEVAKENDRKEGGDATGGLFQLKPQKPRESWSKSQPAVAQPPKKDGFENSKIGTALKQPTGAQDPKQILKAQQLAQAQKAAAAKGVGTPDHTPLPERPPDAFKLLHQAKESGVLYQEDYANGGGEDQDDPELAAAVEETIRLLFGVRGILRVGPGKNEANQPIIVVVASGGFGEASIAAVPAKVHRFETLLALPYELLPLRRER